MRVCNLLCDVILSIPSSPAQSVGVGNWVHHQHCVLRILDTFIVHQWLPIKVGYEDVRFSMCECCGKLFIGKGVEANNTHSVACIQCKIQDWMVHVLLYMYYCSVGCIVDAYASIINV